MCIFWSGHRIGKGEGFADLEFAMLVKMNAVDENTVIATTVHDDQVWFSKIREIKFSNAVAGFSEYSQWIMFQFKMHQVFCDWMNFIDSKIFSPTEPVCLLGPKFIQKALLLVFNICISSQVRDELPEHLFKEHDVPVDIIITPTQIIEVAEKLPRPTGIIWEILSNRRILEIPILQKLREKEQRY